MKADCKDGDSPADQFCLVCCIVLTVSVFLVYADNDMQRFRTDAAVSSSLQEYLPDVLLSGAEAVRKEVDPNACRLQT